MTEYETSDVLDGMLNRIHELYNEAVKHNLEAQELKAIDAFAKVSSAISLHKLSKKTNELEQTQPSALPTLVKS